MVFLDWFTRQHLNLTYIQGTFILPMVLPLTHRIPRNGKSRKALASVMSRPYSQRYTSGSGHCHVGFLVRILQFYHLHFEGSLLLTHLEASKRLRTLEQIIFRYWGQISNLHKTFTRGSSLIILKFILPFGRHQSKNTGTKSLLEHVPITSCAKPGFQGQQLLLILIIRCSLTFSS